MYTNAFTEPIARLQLRHLDLDVSKNMQGVLLLAMDIRNACSHGRWEMNRSVVWMEQLGPVCKACASVALGHEYTYGDLRDSSTDEIAENNPISFKVSLDYPACPADW